MKSLKRDEIIDKLRKTEFIAGNFGANKRVLEKAEKERIKAEEAKKIADQIEEDKELDIDTEIT